MTTEAKPLTITYKNHRGEVAERRIAPLGAPFFGSTQWHPEPQWFLRGYDVDKDAVRDFAMDDMTIGLTFQARVEPWLLQCFGPIIAGDREERNHRFLEEALELVQSTGCTADEAHKLVDYVYGRPTGEPRQEVGGVMVTLAALCLANGADMHEAAEAELARIWTKVEAIREKQRRKPQVGPLPGVYPEREAGQ